MRLGGNPTLTDIITAKSINLHKQILCFEENTVCHAENDAKQTEIKILMQVRGYKKLEIFI